MKTILKITLAFTLAGGVGFKLSAQDGQASADGLIKQANQLLDQHRTNDAIASIKAAIATDPTSHRPWRALEQITDKTSDAEEAVRCWDEMKAKYPTNAFCLTYHAMALKERGKFEIADYGAEIQKAKLLAPTDPFILFYSVQSLGEMGQYESALHDIKTFRDSGGNEQVNDAVSFYDLLFQAANRQFHGSGLPEGTWEAPAKYEIDVSIGGIEKPTQIQPWLIQLCGANLKTTSFILGGDTGSDFEPKRWKFGGSQDDPFPYAPGLFIWDGSVIAVPKYGTLIANGTHVKYVLTKDGVTKTRTGQVKEWRFVFEDEAK